MEGAERHCRGPEAENGTFGGKERLQKEVKEGTNVVTCYSQFKSLDPGLDILISRRLLLLRGKYLTMR